MYQDLYKEALRIRLVEEKIIELYPSDKIQSPVHMSIGQEAVAVGCCAALEKDDLVFATYRSHAFYLAKGGDMPKMFAELYGRIGGGCKGKAGSMHLAAPEAGFMGASAVVASSIPHAAGAALAAKRRDTGQVIMSVFGDGATEEGVCHETLNFTALHSLPVVFICEDNGLAVHSHIKDRQAYKLEELAANYGIETVVIENGMDFVGVYETVKKHVDDVRENAKPVFIVIKTYRYKEHVGPGDDFNAGYRDVCDYEKWSALDPLVTDKETYIALKPEVDEEVDAAVQFAENSPWPGRDELLTDVW
ncbi:Pyruvate/2-oxoglutarate dehydrogenase complex,dehydrogenase (E1) component, eukaryotic type, alpha subunit [Candidatus Terasakiella magnetica]|uniref:Pyruvate/2-oxoglutarate dehydrogenase complex,dehydrogenase (E1) component, eukaryotic type, alpha subunit n=1 Tax=Candidatus Terasakiella magnetica TaxID=1867952 RepID=A0A1C3RKY6_9PROT|nr:thiamine pyrophosphate-dependent dehydrogenase E1 component subunit alpha [Candidatus Terasakiella magnetica]SCA57839.1 Pyruvate/2-oxoglutarate dehydrogenase complex,dehydrogenase (E1) component, eukaryotic type, alpha subunit [Candidatus Terasakiella magnetica]